jgi:general secretion pathway protein C
MEPIGMEVAVVPALKHSRYVVYFILVSLAAYFISTLFLFYTKLRLVDHSSSGQAATTLPVEKPLAKPPIDHFKSIWERNLFAVAVDEERKVEPRNLLSKIDELSLTSLNCTLMGTIIDEDGESWAVIQDNQTKNQGRYTIGSLVSGAKVVMIIRNKVVLNIDGRDELLVMGIEKLRSSAPDAERTARMEPGKQAARASGTIPRTDAATHTISRDLLQDNINNMAQMMSKVRVMPYMKDGKPEGFRVSQIKADSLFRIMGFQNGDVIRSINGVDILSADDMMKAYNSLKDNSSFSITILRNNQPRTLHLRVR